MTCYNFNNSNSDHKKRVPFKIIEEKYQSIFLKLEKNEEENVQKEVW